MDKENQDLETQVNTASGPDGFSLDDILKEFGGWSKPPEKKASEDTTVIPPDLMRVAPTKPEKRENKKPDLKGDTVRFRSVTQEEAEAAKLEKTIHTRPVEMPEEPPAEEPDKAALRRAQRTRRREDQRLRSQEKQRRRAQRQARRAARQEEPEIVYPSPQEACNAYARVGSLRLRIFFSVLCTVASILLLLFSAYPIGGVDLRGHLRILSIAMLALLLTQSVLSLDVFVRGLYQALRLRFDLMSLLSLTVAVTAADSFFAIAGGRIPLCTVPSVALLMALWSVSLEKTAKRRTLKAVLSMDAPVAAVKEEKAWHGLDCIFRREGDLSDFTAMLETPDAAQKVMRLYAPLMAAATAALAVLAQLRGSSFLWAWSALLLAALPAGGFLCCYRPFAILAKRLRRAGAAICGWRGAKQLSGESGIVVEDNDLFPAANISMNGMKMYSDLPIRQVVGYATAVVKAAGSGLLPLFERVMEDENGRRYTADAFRQYEGGGLGAEINGDVVLLGSLGFMRLMGVHVPEGTRVQSAVYISVNKELAGIFALTYAPSAGSKAGLHSVMRSPGLTPILATRDFMITPALVKKRYKVSSDRLEFPVVAERVQLSSDMAGENGRQGALMARGSFASFAAAVTGGRLLRRTVHSALLISLLSGILGAALLCLLTCLDATAAASAVNLLLYQLLWQIPTLMVTGLMGKA